MSLSLWYRDRLLGALFIRQPSQRQLPDRLDKGPTISAVLMPADEAGPDAGLWQLRMPFPGEAGAQYQHLPLEPDIVAQRSSRHQTSSSGTVALHPLTEAERTRIRAIPDLSIRDGEGRSYVPRQLRLEEMRMQPEHYDEVFRELPRECLIGQSIWIVFAAFDLGVDAPAT
jgi:hypothetical protein